jgi:hypothetical protein
VDMWLFPFRKHYPLQSLKGQRLSPF